MAAGVGQESVVKLLLDTGIVDIDARDEDGFTPLIATSVNGHMEVVKMLLDKGADVMAASDGWNPLHAAFASGHVGVISVAKNMAI
ncbi:hypothetical protein BFJ66_g16873 [Fusarium oxysporum f. sp. cepae]|uniref:Uncharacterized protein n=1 Tax=Fusarium oxysporum f. sp. cepae TaxID=396571 RepID=A0A3L6MZP8_FUSOX|nr:hypothetical protein BFJ65_g14533 [Fusarium oxysporum f. sp. cepae]RKK23718.1 hypothetical protein BFJ67_g17015 [Fusarium oxysporum f. sp. cepae]RKK26963.1 hypothetical protein BFJ66_g16873 [Fusarium oxysporum f. sp. cepae]